METRQPTSLSPPVLLALIAGVVFLMYSNVFRVPFIFDDWENIEANGFIRLGGLDIGGLWAAAFRSPAGNRPVANVSFALNYLAGGYGVFGYHLVNVLIHVLNGVLVYALGRKLFGGGRGVEGRWVLAALVFVAHPVQTEAVTYVVQRMTSLATMFYLLALWLYLRGREEGGGRRRWGYWAAGVVSWGLALGSKEIALSLPAVVVLYEWCLGRGLGWLRGRLGYVLLVVFGVLLVGWWYLGADPLGRILEGYEGREFSMGERVLTQFRVVVWYLGLVLYPHPGRLNLLHEFSVSRSLWDPPATFLSLVLIGALVASGLWAGRRRPVWSFCVLWFFLQLVLESSVVGLELVFEHRLYLPLAGVAWLAGEGAFRLTGGRAAWAAVLGVLLVLALGGATHARNRAWQDRLTLWQDVIRKSPTNHRGWYNLGHELSRQGRLAEAEGQYRRALELKPGYARAHNNLAVVLERQGRPEEALAAYARALEIKPDSFVAHNNLGALLKSRGEPEAALRHFEAALRHNPEHAEAHNNLGALQAERGFTEEAVRRYRLALRFKPDYAEAHNNLGAALEKQGRAGEAARHYQAALTEDPDYADAHNNLGVLLTGQGEFSRALGHYLELLRLRPGDAGAHNNLGVVMERLGKPQEAIGHYEKALELKPDYPEARNNLAVALARAGRLEEALGQFREALRLRPEDPDLRRNLALTLRLLEDPAASAGTRD